MPRNDTNVATTAGQPSHATVSSAGQRPLCVRRAEPRDLDAMVGLLRELFQIETEFVVDGARQARGLARLLASPDAAVWVAEMDGDVIGMVTVQLMVSTAEGGLSGHLEDLVVYEEHRNAGVGLRLLETAVEWTRSQGATRIQLLADRRNAAAFRFYFRHNWSPTRMVALRRAL